MMKVAVSGLSKSSILPTIFISSSSVISVFGGRLPFRGPYTRGSSGPFPARNGALNGWVFQQRSSRRLVVGGAKNSSTEWKEKFMSTSIEEGEKKGVSVVFDDLIYHKNPVLSILRAELG